MPDDVPAPAVKAGVGHGDADPGREELAVVLSQAAVAESFPETAGGA
jgi:hypothetical protein